MFTRWWLIFIAFLIRLSLMFVALKFLDGRWPLRERRPSVSPLA